MSHARQVFEGSTVGVALRCSEGRFFLRPGGRVNRMIRFLLGHYAEKHGIQLHGFVFMSNHLHLIFTDTRRRMPRFMEELDAMISRVMNHHLGRSGRLWESTPYRSWIFKTPEELLSHLVYVAANPVEAFLVKSPASWPGVISLPSEAGTRRRVAPPTDGLFGRGHTDSALPAEATLELHVPELMGESPERYRRLFQRALAAYLEDLHERDGGYRGREWVKTRSPFTAPKGAGGPPTFGLIPSLTNASQEDREDLKAWRAAVRDAYLSWRVNKATKFPLGAWKAVEHYNAAVASG